MTNDRRRCFFIAEIGSPGTKARRRSDQVLRHIVRPVCEALGLEVLRADEISEPGLISNRIIRMLIDSDVVVADLSGRNPNVFYELGIRHTLGKPLVQLLQDGESLPFDVKDFNTIFFDYKDLDSVENCRLQLEKHLSASLREPVETPVSVQLHRSGTQLEQRDILAEFQQLTDRVARELAALKAERRKALRDAHTLAKRGADRGREAPLSGSWTSNIGSVFLAQEGHQIMGKYVYLENDDDFSTGIDIDLLEQPWTGELYGQLIDDAILFRWNWLDGSFFGVGFWRLLSDQELSGGWFYQREAASYESVIESPEALLSRPIPIGREWNLFKSDFKNAES